MARDSKDLIVALDIGTSKVACLVAELRAGGRSRVWAMTGSPCLGDYVTLDLADAASFDLAVV